VMYHWFDEKGFHFDIVRVRSEYPLFQNLIKYRCRPCPGKGVYRDFSRFSFLAATAVGLSRPCFPRRFLGELLLDLRRHRLKPCVALARRTGQLFGRQVAHVDLRRLDVGMAELL
jgi:hypothetical protein